MFSFFGSEDSPPPKSKPADPQWAKTEKGKFHRLIHLRPETLGLAGVAGVFVIWHSGMKPEWVYVSESHDLAGDLADALENDDILEYQDRGGLFVTWSRIRREYLDGVTKYLHDTLKPVVENYRAANLSAKPIPVLLPGQAKPG